MARAAKPKPTKTLEQTLWDAADKLRDNQEPSEYKHVVLGLVFLKYISDRFEERRTTLGAELAAKGIKPERLPDFLEDRDEYTSHNVFWAPELARWGVARTRSRSTTPSSRTTQPCWSLATRCSRRSHRSSSRLFASPPPSTGTSRTLCAPPCAPRCAACWHATTTRLTPRRKPLNWFSSRRSCSLRERSTDA